MFNRNTDKEWEKFGKSDPYYGVITFDKYRRSKLTDAAKREFFTSGSEHVAHILDVVRKHIDPSYSVRRALDFGCGVGRVVIPLSEVAQSVTGVDVSESMLKEAKRNCDARGITNVDLVKLDDTLSSLTETFDFVHSYVVFQHIPVKRGDKIFAGLFARIEPGGVGVVHFTYARRTLFGKVVPLIKRFVPFSSNVANVLKRKSFFAPVLQMNSYDLNKVLSLIHIGNVSRFYAEFTDHGGVLGINVYFQKPVKA